MSDIKNIRQTILKMVHKAGVSHVGSALSIVDVLYILYFKIANVTWKNLSDNNRDIVILSKGHASAALYSVLFHKGLLPKEFIESYSTDEGKLPCHIDKTSAPFLDASTGSLGHGLCIGGGDGVGKKDG